MQGTRLPEQEPPLLARRHFAGPMIAALLAASAAAHAQSDRHRVSVQVDLNSAAPSTGYASWLAGHLGKLRYDEQYDGVGIGRALVAYEGRLKPTLTAHVVADYVDDASRGLDLTEAYVEWRPVPRSANRQRVKIGAFFPPLSLENTERGWTNPFTISSAAINTWIGEEVRTLGAEWSLQRSLGPPGSLHRIRPFAAFFYGNDPAGALLAWRGWSLHDRQTRSADTLPLPALPTFVPGAMFDRQPLSAEPFVETDHRPGYYAGAEWRIGERALLAAMHYDNRADPLSLRGQYGWRTRFDHLGAQFELPRNVGLIAQRIAGTTAMGPLAGRAHVVDAKFQSSFVLLTKPIARHRLSVRFDDFAVGDRDGTALDDNTESGRAWTLAYHYEFSARLGIKGEWLSVDSTRPARLYFGLPARGTERIVQMQLSFGLDRQPRDR